MKRALRCLFNVCVAISFALCVTMTVLAMTGYGLRYETYGWASYSIAGRYYTLVGLMTLDHSIGISGMRQTWAADECGPLSYEPGWTKLGGVLSAADRYGNQTFWQSLGFDAYRSPPTGSYPTSGWGILVPNWFCALIFGVLPLWLVRRCAREFKASRRRCNHLCDTCGYDLRATPERCPECGMTPAKVGQA